MLDITLLRRTSTAWSPGSKRARRRSRFSTSRASPRSKPSARRSRPAPRNCRRGATRCPSRSASSRPRASDVAALMAEVGGIGDELKARPSGSRRSRPSCSAMLMAVPNLPHDERAGRAPTRPRNVEVRRWGTPRDVRLRGEGPRRPRRAAGPGLRTGAKLSRLALHRSCAGPIARLHRALAQFMLDMQTAASTATPSATRPTSSTARSCAAPASCPSSRTTCSGSAARRRAKAQRRAVPDPDLARSR